MVLGEDDPVFPVLAGVNLGVRLFSGLVDEADVENLPNSASVLELPARANFNDTTRGMLILESLLEPEAVHSPLADFLATWLGDPEGIPTLNR